MRWFDGTFSFITNFSSQLSVQQISFSMTDIDLLASEVGLPLFDADVPNDVPIECIVDMVEEDEPSMDTSLEIEKDEEEIPEVSVPDTATNNDTKRHCKGKVEMVYLQQRRARRDCFFKRKTGLLKKAKELAVLTGAKVSLRIANSDTTKVYQYYSDPSMKPSLTKRHVRCQVGAGSFTSTAQPSTSQNTPTKSMPLPTSTSLHTRSSSQVVATPIQGLPGKKSNKAPPTKTVNTCNKCKVCGVIYNCKQDKLLQKEHGKQNAWLGCDNESCQYWVHARCAGIKLPSRGKVTSVPFLCPNHKS